MDKEKLVELWLKPLVLVERVLNKFRFDYYKGTNLRVSEEDRKLRKALGIAQVLVGVPVVGGAVALVGVYVAHYA